MWVYYDPSHDLHLIGAYQICCKRGLPSGANPSNVEASDIETLELDAVKLAFSTAYEELSEDDVSLIKTNDQTAIQKLISAARRRLENTANDEQFPMNPSTPRQWKYDFEPVADTIPLGSAFDFAGPEGGLQPRIELDWEDDHVSKIRMSVPCTLYSRNHPQQAKTSTDAWLQDLVNHTYQGLTMYWENDLATLNANRISSKSKEEKSNTEHAVKQSMARLAAQLLNRSVAVRTNPSDLRDQQPSEAGKTISTYKSSWTVFVTGFPRLKVAAKTLPNTDAMDDSTEPS